MQGTKAGSCSGPYTHVVVQNGTSLKLRLLQSAVTHNNIPFNRIDNGNK